MINYKVLVKYHNENHTLKTTYHVECFEVEATASDYTTVTTQNKYDYVNKQTSFLMMVFSSQYTQQKNTKAAALSNVIQ